MEAKPFVSQKMGVRESQKLEHASGRLLEQGSHRWFFVGSLKVKYAWVSGAAAHVDKKGLIDGLTCGC